MVPVNTKLQFTVLTIQTWVESCQIRNRFQIFVGGLVLVLKTAFIALGAWPAEVMVIAEFVVCGSAFDFIEDCCVDGDWGIETAGTGDPGRLCDGGNWC